MVPCAHSDAPALITMLLAPRGVAMSNYCPMRPLIAGLVRGLLGVGLHRDSPPLPAVPAAGMFVQEGSWRPHQEPPSFAEARPGLVLHVLLCVTFGCRDWLICFADCPLFFFVVLDLSSGPNE